MWWKLTTRSPVFHFVTPGPATTTLPATSCPKIWGGATKPCLIFLMSVPHIPQAATRISTSPAPIAGTGTSSSTTRPLPRYTAARIVEGTGDAARHVSRVAPDWLILPPPYPARWKSYGRSVYPCTHPKIPPTDGPHGGNPARGAPKPANRRGGASPARGVRSSESVRAHPARSQ